ncbi:hypothetical protein [Streptomyces phaeochromogenes]|uniref:hypothetical protein n=1 Tax=Streptomyces phaeochromogenes TaxID=1923 RepID=UPI002DDA441B|nr:hypothetical protein [Streptomyces phaeochromogenes]WRZ30233.1 hypothetical protein OG931_22010 [Streptomyces phaeochromogenes]
MQQATQQTSSTAPPETRAPQPRDRQADSFEHASALGAWYFRQLTSKPYAVEVADEHPTGHQVHLKFRSGDARGVLQFAALTDASVTRAETAFGVHLDVYARVHNVLLRASTLLSYGEAAQLDEQTPPPHPPADNSTAPVEETGAVTVQPAPAPAVVSLGSSVSAVVPVVHVPSESVETAGGER